MSVSFGGYTPRNRLPLTYNPLDGTACFGPYTYGDPGSVAYAADVTNSDSTDRVLRYLDFAPAGLPAGVVLDTTPAALTATFEVWTDAPNAPGAVQLYSGAGTSDPAVSPLLIVQTGRTNTSLTYEIKAPPNAAPAIPIVILVVTEVCIATTVQPITVDPSEPFNADAWFILDATRLHTPGDAGNNYLGQAVGLTWPRMHWDDRLLIVTQAEYRFDVPDQGAHRRASVLYELQGIAGTTARGNDIYARVDAAVVDESLVAPEGMT